MKQSWGRKAKFRLIWALRCMGLLKVADAGKFAVGLLREVPANRRFRKAHPDFATPPTHLAFDALNHFNWAAYLETGLQHAGLFARIIRSECPTGMPLEVLEWGCGPGRLIRHVSGMLTDHQVRLTGADYNPESVAWCRRHLPGIDFVENGLSPPLPLEGSRFDVAYNYSVLTHLSETMQRAWLLEMERVLKPGGLLICTTAGEAFRHLLTSDDEIEAFQQGRPIVQGGYREGRKWFLALHPETAVRDGLLAGWSDVRRIEVRADEGVPLDVWIARRPGVLEVPPATVATGVPA